MSIKLSVHKNPSDTNSRIYRVYGRPVSEGYKEPYTLIGDTTKDGIIEWVDAPTTTIQYEFIARAIDADNNELEDEQLHKTITIDPPAPDPVTELVAAVSSDTLFLKWTPSSSKRLVHYEIRRQENPGTTPSWNQGKVLGTTKEITYSTTAFPFDTDVAFMVAAWDGYKYSTVSDTILINTPPSQDTVEVGEADLGSSDFPGTTTGWTKSTQQMITHPDAPWDNYSDPWDTYATEPWESPETGWNAAFPQWPYEASVVDLGGNVDISIRPKMDIAHQLEASWDAMLALFGLPPVLSDPRYRNAMNEDLKAQIFHPEGELGCPGGEFLNFDGEPTRGIPIYTLVRTYLDGSWTDYQELLEGKEYFCSKYQLKFLWKPYISALWSFQFNDLRVPIYRKNKKIEMVNKSIIGDTTVGFVDPQGEPVLFFNRPVINVVSRTPGVSFIVQSIGQTGGLYNNVIISPIKAMPQAADTITADNTISSGSYVDSDLSCTIDVLAGAKIVVHVTAELQSLAGEVANLQIRIGSDDGVEYKQQLAAASEPQMIAISHGWTATSNATVTVVLRAKKDGSNNFIIKKADMRVSADLGYDSTPYTCDIGIIGT